MARRGLPQVTRVKRKVNGMAKRIAVVVSQGQSASPAKRKLEEDIVAGLLFEPGIDVVVIPHLYDLTPEGTGMLALNGIMGNMIVISWLYDRAARWTLDRCGIRGKEGATLLKSEEDDEEDENDSDSEANADSGKVRVVDMRDVPNRRIYCLDLRINSSSQVYIDECKRIAKENAIQLISLGGIGMANATGSSPVAPPASNWIGGGQASADQMARFNSPTNTTALNPEGTGLQPTTPGPIIPQFTGGPSIPGLLGEAQRISEDVARRWYPVIDYSRCTNCMECIDFCLFGVYGVDRAETILVEQPDNCRKGCPACSRVCPENAIIFPQHKTPTIAGADVVAGGIKIDLSLLFGAPETGESAEQAAIRERDEQLVAAGRDAVGAKAAPVGGALPKRHEQTETDQAPKDDLDKLLDELDTLDI